MLSSVKKRNIRAAINLVSLTFSEFFDMKRQLTIFFGFIASIFFSAKVWALPPCPGSYNERKWNNCVSTRLYEDGSKYVGEFKDGKQHGQGTYTYANGDKYVGGFKDGNWHGQGTLTFANGDKYVGEWKDDKKHGQGTTTYANGDKYVGEFKDDRRHGQGTVTFAD